MVVRTTWFFGGSAAYRHLGRSCVTLEWMRPAPPACSAWACRSRNSAGSRTPATAGVGSTRQCISDRGVIEQTILAWEEPRHLAFSMDRSDQYFRACVPSIVDDFKLIPTPTGGTQATRTTSVQVIGRFRDGSRSGTVGGPEEDSSVRVPQLGAAGDGLDPISNSAPPGITRIGKPPGLARTRPGLHARQQEQASGGKSQRWPWSASRLQSMLRSRAASTWRATLISTFGRSRPPVSRISPAGSLT